MEASANGSMGAQIREAREAHGLTLKALAEAVGVTPSLLSQVENDKAQPSLNTLRRVAVRLRLSGDALLGLGDAAPAGGRAVQRRADHPTLRLDGGAHWERLGGSVERAFEIVRITYPPRSTSAMVGERVRFQGYEFGVLLSGNLTLHLGFDSVALEAGDSVHFDTSEPHAYENTTDDPAEGVWFIVRDPVIQARVLAALRSPGRGRGTGAPLPAVLSALRHEEF